MALDFSNRDPKDPNGISSLDTQNAQDGWVKDDNWSTIYYSQGEASRAGANNKIKVATAITNDGKKYNVIVGANGTPISQVGDSVGQDDDTANRWKQTAPKPIAPGGSPTQRRQAPDGQTHIFGYNPQTGEYDQDQGAVASGAKPPIPAGGSSVTEGTPLPDGTWDNSRPRQVIKDAKGNVVWSEELTGSDLTAWRANQQASQPQNGEIRKPVEGRPGWTSITRTTAQAGNKTETTTYVGPNGGQEVPTLPAEPGKPTQDGSGAWGYWDQSSGTPKWTPITGGPAAAQTPVQVGGQWGVWKPGANGGSPTFAPIATPAARPLPPGLPPLDTSSPEAAHQSYLAQVAWAQQQRQAGVMSTAEITDLLTPSYTAAKSVIDLAQQNITNGANLRGQDLIERGHDIGEVQSRRTAADSGFDSLFTTIGGLATHLGHGNGGLGAAAFREALALRQGYAANAGGYQDVPNTELSPYLQSVRTTTVHPDGTVQVAHPVPAPDTAAVNGDQGTPSQPSPAPVNPAEGEPGHDPTQPVGMAPPAYLGAARAAPAFDPMQSATVARLKREGMSDADIQQLVAEHAQEYGAVA